MGGPPRAFKLSTMRTAASTAAVFSPPDPRAVLRTVDLPVAMLGALLAHPILLGVSDAVSHAERHPLGWTAVAACTAVVAVAHLHLAKRGKSWGMVLLLAMTSGLLFGPLNSGFSLSAVVGLSEGFEPALVGTFCLGCLFGIPAGGVCGIVLGTGFSPLAMMASAHQRSPSHLGVEKARVLGGAMVLVASAIHHLTIDGPAAFQAITAVVGAGMLTLGATRLARMRAFLRDVREGREPQWSLGEARDPSELAGLHPIHGAPKGALVLYRSTRDQAPSPYRAQEQWLPIARA